MPGGDGARSPVVDLSLVVPFFNPGPVVRQTVERAARTLDGCEITFEIISVSDGSTDESVESLRAMALDCLEIVELPTNRGKGHAVRRGLAGSHGRLVGFMDADGDIPPEILSDFVAVAIERSPDIVYGSKRHQDSIVSAPVPRRAASMGYRWLVRALFGLSVPDTQTGIKFFRADVVEAILPHMHEEGFVFDVEMFVLARALGRTNWVDRPVRVENTTSSTVSVRSIRTVLGDTLRLYLRLRRIDRRM
jgi:glycosyltransferase involved in cell wall biosynthesis